MASNKTVEIQDAWFPMTQRERWFAKKDLFYGTNRYLCICETLRLIYDEIHDMKDEEKKLRITKRLLDAFMMGKKMAARLAYYKKKYGDKTGSAGKNLVYILDSKKNQDFLFSLSKNS